MRLCLCCLLARQIACETVIHHIYWTGEYENFSLTLKFLADEVGFEPTRACTLPVFKTGAFNHSATHPPAFILTHSRAKMKSKGRMAEW